MRIFNTFGYRILSENSRVVSNFVPPAVKAELITIYDSGSQIRAFCYDEDLVTGMIAMMVQEFGSKPRVLQFIRRSAAGFKAAKAAIVVSEK